MYILHISTTHVPKYEHAVMLLGRYLTIFKQTRSHNIIIVMIKKYLIRLFFLMLISESK